LKRTFIIGCCTGFTSFLIVNKKIQGIFGKASIRQFFCVKSLLKYIERIMELIFKLVNGFQLAEVKSNDILINETQDALDLLAESTYNGAYKIIIYEKNFVPDFFDLKTRLAGEILQKFSNYRVQLAIVGDFSNYSSKSLRDFIFESNKNKHINFVSSLDEAIELLAR
jgi:hypothetical protein